MTSYWLEITKEDFFLKRHKMQFSRKLSRFLRRRLNLEVEISVVKRFEKLSDHLGVPSRTE